MRLTAICIFILMLAAACGSGNSSDRSFTVKKAAVDPWTAESIAYRYWGSPASPHRNEERYIAFLDSLLASDSLPEGLRERAEYKRQMAMLNRPGTIAADFRFLERHGRESRLHDIGSPLTLLVFYDPECPHCEDILRSLADSKTINTAVAEKNLTVIAIYTEGKRDVWDKTKHELPENWLTGYDLTGIVDEEIYDIPAMPTPYLLDRDKRVILKDPDTRTLTARIAALCHDNN